MSASGCHVLLVDDDEHFGLLTSTQLADVGHAVVTVHSVHEALDHLGGPHATFDVVLLDLGLPDISGLDGLQATADSSGVPVVVYTADARPSLRRAARELGAAAVLTKGDATPAELDRALRDAAAAVVPRRLSSSDLFLPYEGLETAIRGMCELLADTTGFARWAFVRPVAGIQVVLVRVGPGADLAPGSHIDWRIPFPSASSVLAAETIAAGTIADTDRGGLVVGAAMAARIQLDPAATGTLIGWSAEAGVHPTADAGAILGRAARGIATFHDLGHQRDAALRRADIAGNAASVDVLTKLGNRRAFDAYLRAEEDRCVRHEHGGVVFVIDLDHLKIVNDTKGHAAGDQYLRMAAIALTEAMRPTDVVFRIGGDEFATVAVRSDVADAAGIEQRIRERLDQYRVEASIGWAARPPEATLLQAFAAADEAMYRQKVERRAARAESPGSS